MNRHSFLLVLVAVLALWAVPSGALAQPAIDWRTIDCGGGTSTGGIYSLSGTIGQFDAAPPSTGGGQALTGGYWAYQKCPADYEGNGIVTIDDLFLYFNAYFTNHISADMNGSGSVTIDDLFLYLNAYFTVC